MLTCGLPVPAEALIGVGSSHSYRRTGVAPPTCWKSTNMWSKFAVSI